MQRLLIKIPIITNWRHWDFIKANQPNNTVILWRGDSTETQNRTTKNESNCWSVWIDTTQPTKKTKNGKVTVDQCYWTSGILNWKKEGSLMVQGSLLRVKCLCVNLSLWFLRLNILGNVERNVRRNLGQQPGGWASYRPRNCRRWNLVGYCVGGSCALGVVSLTRFPRSRSGHLKLRRWGMTGSWSQNMIWGIFWQSSV